MSVPKRKQLSKATRLEVLNKYDNHCAYCGCELTYEQLNVIIRFRYTMQNLATT